MNKTKEVLNIIKDHKEGLYKHEIAKLLGKVSSNDVSGFLNHLKCYGKIKQGNYGRYIANE